MQAGHVTRARQGGVQAHLTSSTLGRTCAASGCTHIAITKVADQSPVSAGDRIGYEITVTNDSRSTAKAVTMTDSLPPGRGMSWTPGTSSSGWICAVASGTLTCGGKTTNLRSGSSLKVHVTSSTSSETCGTVSNTATVRTSNAGTASVTAKVVVQCAQIRLTKVADHSEVSKGDPIGYTITATNHGSGTARGVTMTDVLPVVAGASWTFSSASPAWTCHIAGGTLTCGGPTTSLAAGDSLRVHIGSPTTSATCGSVQNTAHVGTSNDGTATASARVEVLCARIGLTKTADKSPVSAGAQIGYTITATNHGSGTAHGVTMTDVLPVVAGASWSFSSASPAWTCHVAGGTLTCGGPTTSLAAGDSLHVHVTSPTTSASCGSVQNTAHVGTSNDGTATASARVEVLCAKIALTKTADKSPVNAGAQIGYEITATNGGPGIARGVRVTDTLPVTPGGLSWSIGTTSPGWTCAITSGVLTCGGPSTELAAKASLSVHLTSPTTGDSCGTVDNTAHVGTSNDGSADATASILVQCAQIELTKTADAPTVSAGDQIGYTITATNNGNGPAHDVTMTDLLPVTPGGLSWSIGTTSAGWPCSIASGVLTCGGTGTSLAAAASLSVHITSPTTSASCGTVDNTARVGTSDEKSAHASASILVQCAKITLTKTADKPLVSAGDPIGYTITVGNSGPGTAHGVTMADTLPGTAGTSWSVGTTSPGWLCSITGGVLTCGGAGTSLAAAASVSVHVTSPTTAASCGAVHNTATVATSNDGTATATARIEVLCARIALTKTADKPLVTAGDQIGYQIVVSNHGAGRAHGVTMTDTLPSTPAGLSWRIASASSGWTCQISGGTLTCGGSTTSLAPGDSLRVHITSPTTAASCGTVHNTASALASNDGTATESARIEVLCPRIALTKTADKTLVSAGDQIGYTITATNHGAGTAHGVTMTDVLPATAGTSWTIASASAGWTCQITAGTLTCGGPATTLSFGHSLKVHVTSPTSSLSCGPVDNAASVVTSNDGSASASARIEVQCAAIELTKTADETQVSAGDQIGYTITATNSGAGTAHGVTMTDPLPATAGTSWTIVSASPGWSCAIAAHVLTCGDSGTTLPSGDSLSVHVTSPTTKATCGTVDNSASVVTTNDGTATAAASVEVLCAEIALTKTADHTPVLIGEQIGYTITATSNGPGTARDVTMTDPLPSTPGMSWNIASASPGWTCAITAAKLTCGGRGTSLAPGDSLSVHVTSSSTGNVCGTVENTATVATSDDGTATASATITVLCPMDPAITTKVSKTVTGAGGSVTDTATLTGPSGPVTGTVDFQLCSGTTTGCPQNSGTTVQSGVPLVNGSATSDAFGSRLPRGHYCVGLVYHNDGRSPYADSYSGSQVGECFTVVQRPPRTPPAVTTRLSRHEIAVGGSVRDFATLHRVTKLAGGTVGYRVYSTLRGCRADTLAWPGRPLHGTSAGIVRVRGAVVPGSRSVRFGGAGTYYWAALYSGGARNAPAASRCLTEVLRVRRTPTSITTWLSSHVVWAGSPVLDWATLHGVTSGASGTVQFRYYSTLNGCRADRSAWPATPRRGVFVDRLAVHGTRTPDTRNVRFQRAGTYYWAAFYSGDRRTAPSVSSCAGEILTVK